MDNVYRRDHEMPYISDEAVMAQQKGIKKAIREYQEKKTAELYVPGLQGIYNSAVLFYEIICFPQDILL